MICSELISNKFNFNKVTFKTYVHQIVFNTNFGEKNLRLPSINGYSLFFIRKTGRKALGEVHCSNYFSTFGSHALMLVLKTMLFPA